MYETKSISGVQCVYLSTEKSNFESIYVGRPRSIVRNKSDNRLCYTNPIVIIIC